MKADTNKLAGIKNLRSCNVQSKPLFVSIISAVEEALAFLGRTAICEKQLQLAPQVSQNRSTRFILNESGKWVAAK